MEAHEAILRGGGDFADFSAHCPVKSCPWDHWWETDQADVTIGEVLDVVGTHMAEAHAGR